jgi:hypothetical protein
MVMISEYSVPWVVGNEQAFDIALNGLIQKPVSPVQMPTLSNIIHRLMKLIFDAEKLLTDRKKLMRLIVSVIMNSFVMGGQLCKRTNGTSSCYRQKKSCRSAMNGTYCKVPLPDILKSNIKGT